ncbi:MAG TPA: ABC transporter ATP-binding protein [Gemmataceae bacterium]|nr:ABC transporter ATP-binding protein [Gemmataceae bacterium]
MQNVRPEGVEGAGGSSHSAYGIRHSAFGIAAPVLLCQRVSKWYGPVIGVNQVTLELRSGITGLVGANGAGKSTLMRLITGHLRPDLGSVDVLGRNAWTAEAKRHIGYCPEVDAFYEEMSGRRFVEAMAQLSGYSAEDARRRAGAALERVGMAGRAERRLRGYSKGMRQRIKLAQALLHDPELLVLDEPLSGIDPVGRAEFIALFRGLAEQGKCLLISSHELEELQKLTDHVAVMARGRIAAVGSVAQIRDRLDDHPLTVRVDVARGDPTPTLPHLRGQGREGGDRGRELAGALLQLRDVVGVEFLEDEPGENGVGRLLVRARNPRTFFEELARLAAEGWCEVRRLQTLDESAHAVLGYLLGGGA